MSSNERRRQGEGLLDELRREPHEHRLLVDLGAGGAEDLASLGQQHPDAVLLEHRERRGVELRHLVGAEDLDRRERVLERAIAQ